MGDIQITENLFNEVKPYAKFNSPPQKPFKSYLLSTRSNTPEETSPSKLSEDNSSDRDSSSSPLFESNSPTSPYFFEGSNFEIDVRPKRRKFSTVQDRIQFVEEYKRKFKTEMCKNWELKGTCKFGDKCCFAHGRHELKAKALTHIKYKTKPCKQYHQTGYCPYGQRCQYLHKEALLPNVFCNPAEGHHKSNPQLYEILHEVNRLCGTDVELTAVLDKFPKRARLGVFEKVAMV